MTKETLKEKTAKGLFWGGLSNGIQQLLGVIIGVILLKHLSPEDYGMVGLLAIFMGITTTIQEGGFTAALVNRPTFRPEDYNSVFWFNVVVGVFFYILLYCSAPFIARFYNEPELIPVSRLLFLSILVSGLGIAHNAVIFKKLMVKERAKIDITAITLSGTIAIILAIKGYGYWALVVQTLLTVTINTILKWFVAPWRPSLNITVKPIREMFGFSFKLIISSIITQIQNNIFSVIIGKVYTKTDVGYYSQGTKWAAMGSQVINGMIQNVAQPIFSPIKDDKERIIRVLKKLIKYTALLSFPLLLGLGFIGKELIMIINPEWEPCIPILQMFCFWGSLSPLWLIYNQVAISQGKSDLYFRNSVIFAILQISATCIGAFWSIYWIAFFNILSSIIILLVWHVNIAHLLNMKFSLTAKIVLPYFIFTLLSFLASDLLIGMINLENYALIILCKIIFSAIIYILIINRIDKTTTKEVLDFVIARKIE